MFYGTANATAMSTKRIKTIAFKHTRMQGPFRQLVSTCYCSWHRYSQKCPNCLCYCFTYFSALYVLCDISALVDSVIYYYCCRCTVCTALLFSYSAIFIAASVRNKLIHSNALRRVLVLLAKSAAIAIARADKLSKRSWYPSLMPSFEGNLLTQRHQIYS